eukprot:PhM_4_TR6163/c0_g1_i1/m.104930/K10752/RBBP4, HAT2, CAF1, MIS16; histone-binding protein RBBP4
MVDRSDADAHDAWRFNVPLMYDTMTSHLLTWASPTIDWLPGTRPGPTAGSCRHQLLYGTNAPAANSVIVGEVVLPSAEAAVGGGGDGAHSLDIDARVRIVEEYEHDGAVNRARAMPQNEDIVATQSSARVQFVIHRRRSDGRGDDDDDDGSSQVRLHGGHSEEGFALDWCTRIEGRLATGCDDGLICIWDVGTCASQSCVRLTEEHGAVEDLSWHPVHPHTLAAATQSGVVTVRDVRAKPESGPTHSFLASSSAASVVAAPCTGVRYSPHNETLLLAGAGAVPTLWDVRNTKQCLHSLQGHSLDITSMQWSPFSETTVATCSADGTVCIFDLSRLAQPAGTELLFVHAGHTKRVGDAVFCAEYGFEWYVASVSEDHALQVWQPAEYVYFTREEDCDPP